MNAINKFKEMAGFEFGLFEPYLWRDKIGDDLWHCQLRSCDSILHEGMGKSMEESINNCYKESKSAKEEYDSRPEGFI